MNLNGRLVVVILMILVGSGLDVVAQNFDRMNLQISENGLELSNANVGGLIAPQFNQTDLDGDGTLDLVVFDRAGDIVLPFLNEGGSGEIKYQFAPQYQDVFPDNLKVWMLLRDYNMDGIEDIFTFPTVSNAPGVIVYTGQRIGGVLSYEQVTFPDKPFDFLTIPNGNNDTQIYVANTDIPEVVDVDGDGDLDILAFEVSGGKIFYYRNMSVDNGNGAAELTFVLEDDCFGRMEENGFSSLIELSTNGIDCGESVQDDPNLEIRHAGSTLVALDEDGNGELDLLVGDISNNNLVLLSNTGTADNSWFSSQDGTYPSYDTPLDIDIFNAGYYLDVNNDGLKDLIAAPNIVNALQATEHVWLYLNIGSAGQPIFQLETKQFLLDEMVELGIQSNVALADVNQDGLMDMVIGTSGAISDLGVRQPRLRYYQNTGTVDAPSFDLLDADYLDFSGFETTSNNFSPAFGDLDSDGDIDLLVGDDVGFMYYLENSAAPGQPFDFAAPIYKYQDIRVGQESRPHMVDVDEDGLTDLVIGERNFNSVNGEFGSINYLQNVGSVGAPIFMGVNDGNNSGVFGAVNTRDLSFLNNFSAPYFVDTGDDYNLIVGTESGDLFRYNNIKGNVDGEFAFQSGKFGNIEEGMRTTVAMYDIDNDGYYEALVGNRRGGIAWYNTALRLDGSTSNKSPLILEELITISPNPSTGVFNVLLDQNLDKQLQISVLNASGQSVFSAALREYRIDLNHLPNGVYFIEITDGVGARIVKRVSLVK